MMLLSSWSLVVKLHNRVIATFSEDIKTPPREPSKSANLIRARFRRRAATTPENPSRNRASINFLLSNYPGFNGRLGQALRARSGRENRLEPGLTKDVVADRAGGFATQLLAVGDNQNLGPRLVRQDPRRTTNRCQKMFLVMRRHIDDDPRISAACELVNPHRIQDSGPHSDFRWAHGLER